ncbi:L,D-transpeptidase family protein [Verrucomicrobiaceae bacterium N1E253]|uniref:L,D-transpeptidase family protein n=1 Tax=Oceaniferula marina TaxID=2748318 RepID=A0A851GJM6_9BACT|nr:L,D-transpeptidase family protein [Oceaniferula marina]NWK55307.1 L,D-transpeptidase family protein [Oceaniferula marina]
MNRSFLTRIGSIFVLACLIPTLSAAPTPLKPGEFEWHPERSAKGPLLVVVSIDDQMAYVYRNGVQIARSTVSTGREGKETPTGVFTILQRKKKHESNIYKGAKMPYMQRLTWTGIAMHAGQLPGYPASAGCIRLPYAFSQKLYSTTTNGSTVVITQKKSEPSKSEKPASILLATQPKTGEKPEPTGTIVWEPHKSPSGPVNCLLSYTDKTLYVSRNGVIIGQSPVGLFFDTNEAPPEGVFLMLEGESAPEPYLPGVKIHPWSVLSLTGGDAQTDAVARMRGRIRIPHAFRTSVQQIIRPGTILLATNESSTPQTRSSGEMAIMLPEQSEAPAAKP